MSDKLKSRKLWVATLSALLMWVSALLGMDLDTEQVGAILLPVVTYIVGQSWVDRPH